MYRTGTAYGFWCLFLVGLGGVHRLYLGKWGTGILWLLTAGLFGIGQVVDLFRMNALVEDANVREGHLPHPNFRPLAAGAAGSVAAGVDGNGAAPGRARPTDDRGDAGTPPPPTSDEGTLMRRLLEAAEERGGSLTVTQGVAATGLPFGDVEETLGEMVASGYVDVDNHPETGVVVYRFTEL